MASSQSLLGRCPECHAEVPRGHLLIEYERADGPAAYAECPDCRTVVRPEPT